MATASSRGPQISLNAIAAPLTDALLGEALRLRLGVERLSDGTTVVDAGVAVPGGLEAGLRIAEICMAGLGTVSLGNSRDIETWPWQVRVATSQPVLACLGSQYAGWSLSAEGESRFQALGSGPGRILARKEPLFDELGYSDTATRTCLIIEANRLPPLALAEKICADCDIEPSGLTLIVTPTGSLSGGVQIAARVVEVALHKAHTLGFPLHHILEGVGATPLPPPSPDSLTAMGRTNDTILFAGHVHLFVDGPEDQAAALAEQLPSNSSKDYGKPFAQVFKDYEFDFFKIDPMLFSPAQVTVTALQTGRSFRGGRLDPSLLERSFFSTKERSEGDGP
jgi:methenyltetrahydromethanopterin cyclohydrolase